MLRSPIAVPGFLVRLASFALAHSRCKVGSRQRLFLLFEKRKVLAVAFFLQFLDRDEPEGGGVDAITQTALVGRAIIEHVAEMRIAFTATHFSAFHTKRAVRFFVHVVLVDRFGETRPAAAAVEFVERREKRFAADNIDIDPCLVIVPILVAKRRLGPALLGHAILFGRELLFQIVGGRFRRTLICG